MIDTSSRPQQQERKKDDRYMEMPPRPKRKLPLYIPRIMTDLMWATTKDSTSIHFGFGHKCHKHGRLFDLDHVRTCSRSKRRPCLWHLCQNPK